MIVNSLNRCYLIYITQANYEIQTCKRVCNGNKPDENVELLCACVHSGK